MPDQLQLRGGTTTEHNSFTGVSKEVTVDTTKKTLVVHDGATQGGIPLMRESGGNAQSTVTIGTNGTNAINITTDQKVGIGTGSPANLLTLNHATNPAIQFNDSNTKVAVINSEGTQTNIGSFEGKDIVFAAHAGSAFSEKARLTTDGNFVVGADTAQASNSATLMADGEVTASGFYFANNVGAAMNSEGIRRPTTNAIVFDIATNEKMRLNATGLGINTNNNTAAMLHLMGGDLFLTANSTATNSGQAVYFQSTTNGWGTSSAHSAIHGKRGVSSSGYLQFDTRVNGDTSEKMRLTAEGRLGLGVQVPSGKLDIQGSSSNENQIFIRSNGGGAPLLLWNGQGVTNTNDDSRLGIGRNDVAMIYTTANASPVSALAIGNTDSVPIVFSTNNQQRMRIDGSGNVGIGITPTCGLHVDNPDNSAITQILDTDNAAVKLVFRNNTETGNNVQIGADGSLLVLVTGGVTRTSIGSLGNLYVRSADTSAASQTLKKTVAGADGIDYLQCRDSSNAAKVIIAGDGDITNATNSYGQISDLKIKENITDANSQWDDVKAVKVRNFNFKESTGLPTHKQIGVVAQELETVSAGLVSESIDRDPDTNEDLGTKTKSVKYSVLYMKSFKALQEAIAKIEILEAKVAALEAA